MEGRGGGGGLNYVMEYHTKVGAAGGKGGGRGEEVELSLIPRLVGFQKFRTQMFSLTKSENI